MNNLKNLEIKMAQAEAELNDIKEQLKMELEVVSSNNIRRFLTLTSKLECKYEEILNLEKQINEVR